MPDEDLRSQLTAAYKSYDNPEPAVEAAVVEPETTDVGTPTEVAQETAQAAAERVRDEQGRFARAEQAKVAQATDKTTAAPKDVAQQPAEIDPKAQTEKTRDLPPPSWGAGAKTQWNELAPEVKAAVLKREAEVDRGFARYRGLDEYVKMAEEHQTTLPVALQNYIGIERLLQQDIVAGVAQIAKNFNVDPAALGRALIPRDPSQGREAQPQPGQPPQGQQPLAQQQAPTVDPRLIELLDKMNNRVEQIDRRYYTEQESRAMTEINTFFDDPKNLYAENVAPQMEELIRSGRANTIQEAYETAVWSNPEIRPLLIRQQVQQEVKSVTAPQAEKARQVATQARQAGRSITGGPAVTPPPTLVDEGASLRDMLTSLVNSGMRA